MGGKIGYLGVFVSTIACFAASFTQQTIFQVNIAGLKYAKGIERDLLKRSTTTSYVSPAEDDMNLAGMVVFSDVGCPHQRMEK